MKRIIIIFSLLFIFAFSLADTHIPAGNVNGVWTFPNSPYIIDGEISIQQGDELYIEPGIQVIFSGHYKFNIYGRILAEGTEQDSILFTSADTTGFSNLNSIDGSWHGLRFISNNFNGQENSILNRCCIEYAKTPHDTGSNAERQGGGIYINLSSNLEITNCEIPNNVADYGGGIYIWESSPILSGLTIKNNYGRYDGGGIMFSGENTSPTLETSVIEHNKCSYDGGGIYICSSSSPIISDCRISYNDCFDFEDGIGGGISCYNAFPVIQNTDITYNYAKVSGGGVYCESNSEITFSDVLISENIAHIWGGGISVENSTANLSGTTISFNTAEYHEGGGIRIIDSELNFDSTDRCNIYFNNTLSNGDLGNDLISNSIVDVIVDTFTVMEPNNKHASPLENFTFDILNCKANLVNQDLYVSPTGSNSNSGITPDDPLLTIYQAIEMINPNGLNPLIIHLAEGIYSPSSTGEIYPLEVKDYISITGESQNLSIIDAEETNFIVKCYETNDFSMSNLTIKNGYNINWGGGLSCEDASISISDVTLINNTAYAGGGISLIDCTEAILTNVILKGNTAYQLRGGGIYCYGTNLMLSGVSISENSSASYGGGVYFYDSNPFFDPDNLCNIYLNNAPANGNDLGSHNCNINVIVDTFTVMNPNDYFATLIENFTFDILYPKIETVDADLYVSTEGSDTNSGITPDEPLLTITWAYQLISENSLNPHTIFLENGIYSPSQTGEIFPLKCRSYITLMGEDKNLTILDAQQTDRVLNCFLPFSSIQNLTVTNGNRGGIYIGDININVNECTLINLVIKNNYSFYGGGIYCYYCDPIFENLIIQNNTAEEKGGGISLNHSDPTITNISVTDNYANIGGGIYFKSSFPIFSLDNRSSIYSNNTECNLGREIYSYMLNGVDIDVYLDTFTVLQPDDYFAKPIQNYNFDILNSVIEQVDQDLYVSPEGSNLNSGLTADDPLQTISYALLIIIPNSSNPHTIHLAEGIYSPVTTGEIFPIYAKDYISLKGENAETTILDGNDLSRILYCNSDEFSLQAITICHGNAINNNYYPEQMGGGIYCGVADLILSDVIIKNNKAVGGGGIYCTYSSLEFRNVSLTDNTAINYSNGGGIYCSNYSNLNFINTTISENSANEYGGGIYCINSSNLSLMNCILRNNSPQEVYFHSAYSPNTITISYSDIQDGETGIVTNNNGTVNWLEGNIDADPLFADPQNGDFHLTWANFPIPDSTMSPCIDAGNPNSPLDPDSTIADMGAYYFDQNQTGIGNLAIDQITKPQLHRNYPNPFNPETTIKFTTENTENTEIIIYNIKGQKVKTYSNLQINKSSNQQIIWNGTDDNGKNVSSGIYFYQLKIDDKTIATKKCLLLK